MSVMLPLNTISARGTFRYDGQPWFAKALRDLACSGVRSIAFDVWVRRALHPDVMTPCACLCGCISIAHPSGAPYHTDLPAAPGPPNMFT